MSGKAIFRFNSVRSDRFAAWLAFAFLAVGALGISVQAQTPWLDENLNSLTEGSPLAVGSKCVAVGTAGYATGATGGGAVRFFKAAAISGTDARWSLSDSYATARPSGYITFKIQQTPGVTASATGYMTFRLGANDANNLSSGAAAWFEARFFNQPYVSSGVASANANLMTYFGAAGSKIQNTSINNGSSPVKIEIWYNNTISPMNYTSPATQGTVALSANSFVIYAGNALVTAAATGNAIVPSVTTSPGETATSVGKIGFVVGTAQSCDFIVDDIYAADSAPVVSVPFAINSATTATVQAGSSFSYPITTSGGTATSYDATGLPSYLSINAATGVISGTVPASTPATTTPITIGLSAIGATTVTANLALTVTAAPSDFVWANTGPDWGTAASWTNNAVPSSSSTAGFGSAGSSATNVNVGTGQSIAAIVFYPIAYAYSWTGTDIKVGSVGGITNNSTATQTFGNKVINSGGDTTWSTASGGSLVFNGGIDLTTSGSTSGRTLTFAGAGNVTVNSAIANGGTATAGAIISASTGTNTLSGANTYGGTTKVTGGTLVLSNTNTSSGYILVGSSSTVVLKVSAINALNSSATLLGSSSTGTTGTLEFVTAGNYALNQYLGQHMNFSNSSGSASTLSFTNATNTLGTTSSGKKFVNKSTDLTINFNGEVNISGTTSATNTITTIGPVVISNRVFSTNTDTATTRSLLKDEAGTLTMYGVNRYNGTTTVVGGTLVIPAVGSLVNCGATIVKGTGSSAGNSASLNLAGEAGVVQVSTNGFVRGGGSITSLQVQEAGAVEVAVGSTWTTGGTIDFAVGSKVSVTGTPTAGNTYTLMTASSAITGSIPTLEGVTDWQLAVEGTELKLKQVQVADGFSQYLVAQSLLPGTAFDAVVNGSKVGLQYAFGSPTGMPQNNGVTAVPVIAQLPNGDQQMTYTFEVKDDSALTVTYQTSTDLVTWSAAQAVSAGTGSAPSGFLKKQVQVTGLDRLFVRINVTR